MANIFCGGLRLGLPGKAGSTDHADEVLGALDLFAQLQMNVMGDGWVRQMRRLPVTFIVNEARNLIAWRIAQRTAPWAQPGTAVLLCPKFFSFRDDFQGVDRPGLPPCVASDASMAFVLAALCHTIKKSGRPRISDARPYSLSNYWIVKLQAFFEPVEAEVPEKSRLVTVLCVARKAKLEPTVS